jgi:hypothetical protein
VGGAARALGGIVAVVGALVTVLTGILVPIATTGRQREIALGEILRRSVIRDGEQII